MTCDTKIPSIAFRPVCIYIFNGQSHEFLIRFKVKMCLIKDCVIGQIGNLQARAMRALEAKKDGGWGEWREWKGEYSRDATYLAGPF